MSTVSSLGEGWTPLIDEFFDEKVDRYVLRNGLVVLIKEDHSSKLASAQVWVKAGSICEGENLGSGLSHFLEHMLFKGTHKRPGIQISRDVQEAGGNINAYTTFDRTVYYIDLPSESINLALDVLGDAVFNALLPKEEVDREREVILREIDMGMDDPDRRVTQALFGNAYRLHPYRNPVIGYREVFEKLQRESLVTYYKAQYVPNNIVLVVVGDVDVDTVKEEVERNFGKYPRVSLPASILFDEPQQLALREEHLYGDVNICRGGLAFKTCGMVHPDGPALDVLAAVLGGGNSSVLWRRLREEKKIVHYVDAATWTQGTSGMLWISYLCDNDKRPIVQDAILEEIEGVGANGFTEAQIAKVRRQALVSEIDLRKTMSGQASRLGLAEVVIGDLGYPRNYFRRIEAVSTQQLVALTSKYLRRDRLTAVSLNAKDIVSRKSKLVGEPLSVPKFETVVLPNGARIVWQKLRRLPKVHLRPVFRGGALYESPLNRGVTGILATLLTKDTMSRDTLEISETVEGLGASFGEFIGNNTFGFFLEVMSSDVAFAVELLGECMLSPAFKNDTFERERMAQIASLNEELDEIVDYGKKYLRDLFFGDHPLSVDPQGTIKTMECLTQIDVKRHFEKLVRGGNLVLGVSGDFDEGELIPKLSDLLGEMKNVDFTPETVPFDGPACPGVFERNLNREQAVIFQAYPDVGIIDPRYHAGEILVELFSEMSGRLFLRVREELGLAYFVGASRISGIESGMFYFCCGTHPDSHKQVGEEFNEEVHRVRSGKITESELRRCQRRLKAQKRMSLQTIGSCAMQAALNVTYNLPANDWSNYDERIDSITTEDLRKFAIEMLNPDRAVRLVVKP
ncbi:MAG: putative zinc protease [Candidatus Moanabacter tarae]|uniref:Putative zinc protease n=1 Tax=Candidatus Moanibacter tarae TaxID=2200854 RepID=A0A2Z4AE85_9BACT|nr:MAG: putative zinc protease [Candidatus Moanabacter tarae]|tara:strand:- start:912 stop:3476 length:2565 start_codon:yes stop_codon:yes gene_type:complete